MISKAFFGRTLYLSIFLAISLILSYAILYVSPTIESAEQNREEQPALENYDIRQDKSAQRSIENFISESNKTNAEISDLRKKTKSAESDLKKKFANIKIEYNNDLRIPEVIARNSFSKNSFLTTSSNQKRNKILRDYLKNNQELFGQDQTHIDELKTIADYTNPNGILSFVHLAQRFNGIPVFNGEVKAGFTKDRRLIRIINNLAPNVEKENLSTDFSSPKIAFKNAAKHINFPLNDPEIKINEVESSEQRITFERARFTDQTTAEKIYFPIENGVLRNAWRVLLWTKDSAYYVIVDARDGTLLWRKNITEHQTESATYNVYGNQTSSMKTADSPSPFSPGCTDPNNCSDPPIIPRTNFTLVGNEPPYDFNNLGWIPNGENRTIGNNVEAGIDRDGTQGIDPNGWAFGDPNRIFSYAYNPAPGNPTPGEEPVPTTQTYPPSQFQQGSITQAFYTVNRWHDETYLLGFTEASFNFQADNFGRGGFGGDSISVEVQDSSGVGANFSTPADGGRPRAQFSVFTFPTPDRDSALDSQIVVHELTHGLSSRLHGNASGLGSNMSRGIGEGFSDFYSLALLSEPTDSQCGVYSVAGYITEEIVPGAANYYYGIRRFPTARISCTGTNGNPHNPLTFADLNAGCDISDGAYPRGPIGSATCDQVHNAGEIWSQALWEVRGVLIEEHGAVEGNRRAMDYALNGMKLTPLNPTFVQERDAIIAATAASDPNDVSLVRQGFAIRGLGIGAEVISASPANVVESFEDSFNVSLKDPFTFTEQIGNGNGFPEVNETLTFSIILENNSGEDIQNVTANINGGKEIIYGDMPNGIEIKRLINYTIPFDAPCGSLHDININITSSVGNKTITRRIRIGQPDNPATFENNNMISVPAGMTAGSGPASPYPSVINVLGLGGNKSIKVELTDIEHTWVGDVDILLESPLGDRMVIMSDSFSASNRTGTVVSTLTLTDEAFSNMPSTGVPPTSGEFKPTNYSNTDTFDAPAPAQPYSHPAPSGNATFESTFGINGSDFNGEWKLWIVDDTGADVGMIAGWKISFESYFCLPCLTICTPVNNVRADFDADGKSDISVYRPSEGNWYLSPSQSNFSVVNWGNATDKIVPADYDSDRKTDFAIFRPNSDPNQPDFYVLNSSNFTFNGFSWGIPGDIPVIDDFDGDGSADVSIYRPSQNIFYVLESSSAQVISVTVPNGVPLSGDFDGDGKADFATFNNGQWFITNSENDHQTSESHSFGLSTDKLVPNDYDGDGRTDLAVFRPSNGTWYIHKSVDGTEIIQFGIDGDIPVPGDYDGDGQYDIGVYRNGIWYIYQSSVGEVLIKQFGLADDKPIPAEYLP